MTLCASLVTWKCVYTPAAGQRHLQLPPNPIITWLFTTALSNARTHKSALAQLNALPSGWKIQACDTQPLRFSVNDNCNMPFFFSSWEAIKKTLMISFWCPNKGKSHFNIHHWLITVWPRFPNIKREKGVVCSTVTCQLYSKQKRSDWGRPAYLIACVKDGAASLRWRKRSTCVLTIISHITNQPYQS